MRIDRLFSEIEHDSRHIYSLCTNTSGIEALTRKYHLPEDLQLFYRRYSWVKLYTGEYGFTYRFIPIEQFHPTRIDIYGLDNDKYGPKEWITICDVMEGNYICLDLASQNGGEGNYIDCFHETFAEPGQSMIIAKTFTELVEKALHTGNALFFNKEGFQGYGDGRPLTAENVALRCETPNPSKNGWIARFTIREKKKSYHRFFGDNEYGGRQGAFEALKRFIDESKGV